MSLGFRRNTKTAQIDNETAYISQTDLFRVILSNKYFIGAWGNESCFTAVRLGIKEYNEIKLLGKVTIQC